MSFCLRPLRCSRTLVRRPLPTEHSANLWVSIDPQTWGLRGVDTWDVGTAWVRPRPCEYIKLSPKSRTNAMNTGMIIASKAATVNRPSSHSSLARRGVIAPAAHLAATLNFTGHSR